MYSKPNKLLIAVLAGVVLVGCNGGGNTNNGSLSSGAQTANNVLRENINANGIEGTITPGKIKDWAVGTAKGTASANLYKDFLDAYNGNSQYGPVSPNVRKELLNNFFKGTAVSLLQNAIQAGAETFGGKFAGSVAKLILGFIFPGAAAAPDIEKVRYENIMSRFNDISNQIAGVQQTTLDLFSMSAGEFHRPYDSTLSDIENDINQTNTYIARVLKQFTDKDGNNLGVQFDKNELDFSVYDPGTQEYRANDDFIAALVYAAAPEHRLFSSSNGSGSGSGRLSTDQMQKLDDYLVALSNLGDDKAYPIDAAKLHARSNPPELSLLPNYIETLATFINAQYDAKSTGADPKYRYDQSGNVAIQNNKNFLIPMALFYRTLGDTEAKIISSMGQIEKFQQMAIFLRYAGADTGIAVPAAINDTYKNAELEATRAAEAGDFKQAYEIRQDIYLKAMDELKNSYQKRIQHVVEVFNDTSLYPQFTENQIPVDVSSTYMSNNYLFKPTPEFLAGTQVTLQKGTYGLDGDQELQYSLAEAENLLKNGHLYWDREYFRTVSIKTNAGTITHRDPETGRPIELVYAEITDGLWMMQNLKYVCKTNGDGVYPLTLLRANNKNSLKCVPNFDGGQGKGAQAGQYELSNGDKTTITDSYYGDGKSHVMIEIDGSKSMPEYTKNKIAENICAGVSGALSCSYRSNSYGYHREWLNTSNGTTHIEYPMGDKGLTIDYSNGHDLSSVPLEYAPGELFFRQGDWGKTWDGKQVFYNYLGKNPRDMYWKPGFYSGLTAMPVDDAWTPKAPEWHGTCKGAINVYGSGKGRQLVMAKWGNNPGDGQNNVEDWMNIVDHQTLVTSGAGLHEFIHGDSCNFAYNPDLPY